MNTQIARCNLSFAACAVFAAGCGGGMVRTTGVVTMDGQPIEGAVVQLHPDNGPGAYSYGVSQPDGTFLLQTDRKDGTTRGDYRVVVIRRVESPLPAVYASKDTTPLRCTVPAAGPVALALSSKTGGPARDAKPRSPDEKVTKGL